MLHSPQLHDRASSYLVNPKQTRRHAYACLSALDNAPTAFALPPPPCRPRHRRASKISFSALLSRRSGLNWRRRSRVLSSRRLTTRGEFCLHACPLPVRFSVSLPERVAVFQSSPRSSAREHASWFVCAETAGRDRGQKVCAGSSYSRKKAFFSTQLRTLSLLIFTMSLVSIRFSNPSARSARALRARTP